MFTYVLVK